MKKIFLYVLTTVFLLSAVFFNVSAFSFPIYARATAQSTPKNSAPLSNSYACILKENSYFYSLPDEKRGIFFLPKTYYVKVLDYQPDYCKIEYLYDDSNLRKLTGYARTEDLTFVEYVPKRPYLYYMFDVRYEIESSPPINDSSFLTQITVTCTYYGDFNFGGITYCYVLRGDTFGYVPKPANLYYEENTEYADYLAQQTPPKSEKKNNSSKSSPAQIAILVALCLLVPALAALILKQSKRPLYYEPDEQTE